MAQINSEKHAAVINGMLIGSEDVHEATSKLFFKTDPSVNSAGIDESYYVGIQVCKQTLFFKFHGAARLVPEISCQEKIV